MIPPGRMGMTPLEKIKNRPMDKTAPRRPKPQKWPKGALFF